MRNVPEEGERLSLRVSPAARKRLRAQVALTHEECPGEGASASKVVQALILDATPQQALRTYQRRKKA